MGKTRTETQKRNQWGYTPEQWEQFTSAQKRHIESAVKLKDPDASSQDDLTQRAVEVVQIGRKVIPDSPLSESDIHPGVEIKGRLIE